MTRPEKYEYDVALSFAGENRAYVEAVAERLKSADVRLFYDAYEQVNLWGKDLLSHLDNVYRKKAQFCVMFISRHYGEKVWTNQERRSAQARAFQQNEEYILPARFDETEIPGVLPTTGYIDLRGLGPATFADLVLEKIGRSSPGTAAQPAFRVPRIAHKNFNPYEEAHRLIDYLVRGIVERCEALADRGVSCSRFERGGRTCIRVVVNGATRYSLDVWMGGMGGDSGLSFAFGRGERNFPGGGMNAWGSIEWGRVKNQPVLKLTNLSFISGRMGDELELTYEKFLDEVWDEVVKALEGDSW